MMLGLGLTSIGLQLAGSASLGGGASQPPAPVDSFPAELLSASGSYLHFAAEDAGASWTTRHGDAMTLNTAGRPVTSTQSGQSWVDCTNGCYDVEHDGWAGAMPFAIWALTDASRRGRSVVYKGPSRYSTSNATLRFMGNSRVDVGYTSFTARWSLPETAGAESLEWSNPGGSLTRIVCAHNGALVSRAELRDRSTSAAGTCLILGGARDGAGVSQPGGAALRDVVITLGWLPDAAQRAALESYRQARISG